jgi:hypothetical protein
MSNNVSRVDGRQLFVAVDQRQKTTKKQKIQA